MYNPWDVKDEGAPKKESAPKNDGRPPLPFSVQKAVLSCVVALLAGWLMTGFFQVDLGSVAVVTRLGQVVRTESEGWHYRLPFPLEKEYVCDTSVVHQLNMDRGVGAGQTITGDRNLVDVSYTVQWFVSDPQLFMFHLANYADCIRLTADSCMRDAINNLDIDEALSEGRSAIEDAVKVQMQKVLDSYGVGMWIQGVTLRKLDPPQEVAESFYDVEKAWADHHYAINQAEALRNEMIPEARAHSVKAVEHARAEAYSLTQCAEAEKLVFDNLKNVWRSDAAQGAETFLVYDILAEALEDKKMHLLDSSVSHSILPILSAQYGQGKTVCQNKL